MGRMIRAVAALTALVAVLVGVPFALVRFVGRVWPRPMPSLETIWATVSAGDITDTTVIKALAAIVWIAWARLAVSIVIEAASRLGGRPAPRIALLGSAQQWAAALIAAIALVGTAPRTALAGQPGGGPRPILSALLVQPIDVQGRLPNRHPRQFEQRGIRSVGEGRRSLGRRGAGRCTRSRSHRTRPRARPATRSRIRRRVRADHANPRGAPVRIVLVDCRGLRR